MGVLTLSIVARLIWRRVDMNAIEASKSTKDILAENYLVTWHFKEWLFCFIHLLLYISVQTALKLNNEKKVTQMITKIWSLIFLPLLFSLIGNEIDFQKLTVKLIGNCFRLYSNIGSVKTSLGSLRSSSKNYLKIGLGIAIIFIGSLFRMLATFLSVSFGVFNLRESLFLCCAWLPKATIQVNAALYKLLKTLFGFWD